MNILVAGSGQIGSLLAQMLASNEHRVYLMDSDDSHFQRLTPSTNLSATLIDVNSEKDLAQFVHDHHIEVMVACLPIKKPDGSLVLVVAHPGSSARDVVVEWKRRTLTATLAARLVATFHWLG